MELRTEEDAWTQRILVSPIRRLKPARNQPKVAANAVLEAVSAAGKDGRTRLKFVVRRDDLKQVLEAIRDGRGGSAHRSDPVVSAEQRLSLLRRRHMLKGRDRSSESWCPALQSIPEE